MPTIQYRFKRRLFSRRPCTGPYPWAGPSQDCSDWIYFRVKIAAIGFNNSIVIQLVLILCFTQSASMPESPEQARDQARPYVQKGLYGPDGNWLSKRARQNQAGSTSVASPVQP